MSKVPVRVVKKGLVPPPAAAWVPLPRLIVFAAPKFTQNVELMAHELMHVLQAEEYGWRWPLVYVAQWVRSGFSYTNMPFEVEARDAQKNFDMLEWAREVIAQNEF